MQRASELTILEYVDSLDLNPSNVYYQRIASNNVSTSGAQWSITSPNKRSMLLSFVQVEWTVIINRVDDEGAASDFTGAFEYCSFKPLLPFTNSMLSQTLSINGNTLTLSQPRRFIEPLSRLCVSKEESKACFESEWWDDVGGNLLYGKPSHPNQDLEQDSGLKRNENLFISKLIDAGGDERKLDDNSYTIQYNEPLIIPPLNPFAKLGTGMPNYMPFKRMSPVIPNIDRLEIDIQFDPSRIDAGCMFFKYGRNTAGDAVPRRLVFGTAVKAKLLLYWYEVPVEMSVPRSIRLQTWNIIEFQTSLESGTDIDNGERVKNVVSDLIQLRSVPTLIIMHARRRQTEDTYINSSMVADQNSFGVNSAGSANNVGVPQDNPNHSLDCFMEIESMNVLLGDRPNVINTNFGQRELYYLCVKNAKYKGFSLGYSAWRGSYAQVSRDNSGDNTNTIVPLVEAEFQMAKGFMALQPKDLAERISSGVFFPNSLQFEVNFRARDGACGLRGGPHKYDMFIHILIGKHFLELEPDRARYNEQNIPLEAAERATRPSMTVNPPTSGAGAYISRY